MGHEPTNVKTTSHTADQRQIGRELRDMLSTLTHRLFDHHNTNKTGKSIKLDETHDEEDHGVSIITLAGTNTGATMRAESDEKSLDISSSLDQETMTAYANSNFQAINNSIMFGGSYSCNDPGIHMETIDDYVNEQHDQEHHSKPLKPQHGKKGKKKETGTSKKVGSHSTEDEYFTD